MNKVFIINPGHGGMLDGKYTTGEKKMYDHGGGVVAYEGVLNRTIADLVLKRLDDLGLPGINLCPTNLDIELDERVDIANTYVREFGKNNVLGIDLHSNAGKGEGFEIWTSPGQTRSDYFATQFGLDFMSAFPHWKYRKDTSDGDPDKESPFYMLVHTKCPWILPEWGFFDNRKDWDIMSRPHQQEKYAAMIANFCKRMYNKNI